MNTGRFHPQRRRADRVAALLVTAAAVSGCSAPTDAPSGITPDEDRQLNQAATKLDASENAAFPADSESPVP